MAPLGVHLQLGTRDINWRGEIVDVFSLLFKEPEPKPWAPGPAVAREYGQYKRPKVEWNWNNWLSSHTIYWGSIGCCGSVV